MQWAHALERLPKIGFVVERFGWCWCGFFNYWRRRFRLEDRRRLRQHAIAIGEHLFQILEWRRENPRGRRRRLSFAFSFVGDSIMLSLFCHRKWLEGPGINACSTDYAGDATRFKRRTCPQGSGG